MPRALLLTLALPAALSACESTTEVQRPPENVVDDAGIPDAGEEPVDAGAVEILTLDLTKASGTIDGRALDFAGRHVITKQSPNDGFAKPYGCDQGAAAFLVSGPGEDIARFGAELCKDTTQMNVRITAPGSVGVAGSRNTYSVNVNLLRRIFYSDNQDPNRVETTTATRNADGSYTLEGKLKMDYAPELTFEGTFRARIAPQ